VLIKEMADAKIVPNKLRLVGQEAMIVAERNAHI
jgi:hypothetical protein